MLLRWMRKIKRLLLNQPTQPKRYKKQRRKFLRKSLPIILLQVSHLLTHRVLKEYHRRAKVGWLKRALKPHHRWTQVRRKMYRVNFPILFNLLLHQLSRNQNLSHPQKRFYKKFLMLFLLTFRLLELTLRWWKRSKMGQLNQPNQAKRRRKRIKSLFKFL